MKADLKVIRIAILLSICFVFSAAAAQDSTFVPHVIGGGDCVYPLEIEHKLIHIGTYTNLKITIVGVSTASFNDFYALVDNRPGSEPIKAYFFQARIPEVGENWTIGPVKLGDKIDFEIFSGILAERTTCDPNRWGEILQISSGHWQINFEDWCDFDWDDLVVDISSVPGNPTVTILTPSHLSSFVTDDAATFRVHAEGWATDLYGGDISRYIDWFVVPGRISGRCFPSTRQNSRIFDFVATIQPRSVRGLGRLEYDIHAISTPYFIPITDLNVMVQDDIDTVRQQYVDYAIKLPYKSRFVVWEGHAIIHTEPILLAIYLSVCPCYRTWAGVANARCVLTSTFRSPVYNRDGIRPPGADTSMHQYGLAIDIGFDSHRLPGKKDDALAIIRCIRTLRLPNIHPYGHPRENYNHVHVQNYRYRNMPYVER